ncbi:MAG: hypothetical protein F6K32_14640 [Desertifilum sp. SIO1I2]|nr:hypothetical protein [Desertifilum sp. SIO1I2]
MKPELKRIEATLDRISSDNNRTASASPTYSFQLLPATPDKKAWPKREESGKPPSLPKLKTPSFSTHQNAANPALAVSLLTQIQEIAQGWQDELQQTVRSVQDLYLEGPIVDGWLESEPQSFETSEVRKTASDRLMDYKAVAQQAGGQVVYETRGAGYRLCGLGEDGQLWFRPCPPEQVPSVSLAIARYQKLRQLLARKQYLETRLSQLAETLVILHGHLQEEQKTKGD